MQQQSAAIRLRDGTKPTLEVKPPPEKSWWRRTLHLPTPILTMTLRNASSYTVKYKVYQEDAPHPVGGNRSQEANIVASMDPRLAASTRNSTSIEYRNTLLIEATLPPKSAEEVSQMVPFPRACRLRVRGSLMPSGREFKHKLYTPAGGNYELTAIDERLDAVAEATATDERLDAEATAPATDERLDAVAGATEVSIDEQEIMPR